MPRPASRGREKIAHGDTPGDTPPRKPGFKKKFGGGRKKFGGKPFRKKPG